MKKLIQNVGLIWKGMAMGIAEVIPGVSGGTLAFITGIYEELIDTIKSVLSPAWIKAWRDGGLPSAWKIANGNFLVFLLGGMALGVVTGVLVVSHVLEHYPVLLWAFFFGLIIASSWYIGKQVRTWDWTRVLAVLLSAGLAYWITVATPSQGNGAYGFIFFSGMIAISALILPGISGSFILLLMGMYTLIIPAIKTVLQSGDVDSLIILIVFGLGCLLGLATFSRVLSWTFKRFHDLTMAVLTGFMMGSLNKIWPWRNVLSYRMDSTGHEVPFLERSVLPSQFEGDPMVGIAIGIMIVGFSLVFLLSRLGKGKAV